MRKLKSKTLFSVLRRIEDARTWARPKYVLLEYYDDNSVCAYTTDPKGRACFRLHRYANEGPALAKFKQYLDTELVHFTPVMGVAYALVTIHDHGYEKLESREKNLWRFLPNRYIFLDQQFFISHTPTTILKLLNECNKPFVLNNRMEVRIGDMPNSKRYTTDWKQFFSDDNGAVQVDSHSHVMDINEVNSYLKNYMAKQASLMDVYVQKRN